MVNRPVFAILFMLVSGLAVLGLHVVDLLGADDQAVRSNIAKQEMALAEEAIKMTTELEAHGELSPGFGDVARWSRRLAEATRKSGATKTEVVAAIRKHVGRMNDRVDLLKQMRQSGVASSTDVLNAEFEALEAMGWLQDEK